ncbi:MAG: hypothetical protein WC522_08895 [Candidatus Omnitrophota bacterium]
MKCQFCGKKIDEIDSACKMCTICGWPLGTEAVVTVPAGGEPVKEKKADH